MTLLVYKTLEVFLRPLTWIGLLIAAAILLRKRPRLQMSALGAAFGIFAIAGNGFVVSAVTRSLEWRHAPEGELPEADAIVVLAGGIAPHVPPRPGVGIDVTGNRYLHGGRLFREGKAPLLILTGGNLPDARRATSLAEDMASFLRLLGFPEEGVVVEGRGRTTRESAIRCAEIFAQEKIESILLVTSASHMPRAVGCFRKTGVRVTPAPSDFRCVYGGSLSWRRGALQFVPTAGRLRQLDEAIHEYVGLVYYRLRGWI